MLERVREEALLTEVEISDVIKRNTKGLENDKRICELEKAEWAIAQAQVDKVLNTKTGNHTLKEIIEMIDKGELVKLAKDQSLPRNPNVSGSSQLFREYDKAQEDMLKISFRRVEPLR